MTVEHAILSLWRGERARDAGAGPGPPRPGLDERRSWRPAYGPTAPPWSGPHPVVYVVEGDEGAHRLLAQLLREADYEAKPFASAEAFLEIAAFLAPGCVLVGATVTAMGGIALQAALADLGVCAPVIMMGAAGDVGLAVQAMKAGAADFLERPFSVRQLAAAVETGLARLRGAAECERAEAFIASRAAEMTVREREVLEGLLAGGTNKTIGRDLGISPRTVEVHRGRLMERLGARNLSEAISIALAAGFRPAAGAGGRQA